MNSQDILEGITRHRANPIKPMSDFDADYVRKIEEIEWALQAIAEKLVELEAIAGPFRKVKT